MPRVCNDGTGRPGCGTGRGATVGGDCPSTPAAVLARRRGTGCGVSTSNAPDIGLCVVSVSVLLGLEAALRRRSASRAGGFLEGCSTRPFVCMNSDTAASLSGRCHFVTFVFLL